MRKTVFCMAIFTAFCSLAVVISLIVEMTNKSLSVEAFIGLMIAVGINNLLFWALYVALKKIDGLRRDVDTLKRLLKNVTGQEDYFSYYKVCETCGGEVSRDYNRCPNCHEPIDSKEDKE